MADNSLIEWTDATWNPVTGCAVVSPGCANCYAMRLAGGRLQHHPSRAGLTQPSKAGPVWNGQVRLNEDWLAQPLQWKRPRRIFVCAHGDLFAEGVPDAWIDRVFAVMALAPQHTFQVLTKRAARMRAYLTDRSQARADGRGAALIALGYNGPLEGFGWPLPNVWLGVSAEDQPRADERVSHLLATPAAVRFVSAEPLLGPIDFTAAWHGESALDAECWGECGWCPAGLPPLHNCQLGKGDGKRWRSGLDWIIVGGESGDGARPMHPEWVRQIRDDCADAGVPFFFKQWGSWREAHAGDEFDTSKGRAASPPAFILEPSDGTVHCFLQPDHSPEARVMLQVGKRDAGRTLDGQTHSQFPEGRR